MSVRIGTSYHDLQEIQQVDLREPEGWVLPGRSSPIEGLGALEMGLLDFTSCWKQQDATSLWVSIGRRGSNRGLRRPDAVEEFKPLCGVLPTSKV